MLLGCVFGLAKFLFTKHSSLNINSSCSVTFQLEIPNSGIAQGTLIGYGAVASPPTRFVNDWKEDGFFDINARGDQILIYCLVNATEPHFLWGFNTLKEWDISGLSDYDTNTSALPAELVDVGNVAFDHCDNLFWEDPTPKVSSSDKTENLAKFQDPLNYRCNDRLPWKYEEVEPNSSAANWGHENMLSLTIFFFLAWVNLRV